MEIIPSIVDQLTPTTMMLIGVTGSLVLAILIGGLVLHRRQKRRTSTRTGAPQRNASAERAIAAAIEAYTGPSNAALKPDVGAWEDELTRKLAELESRFELFAEKLGRVGALDEDGAEVLRVLTERGLGRDALRPRTARDPRGTDRETGRLRLSEEQLKLVQRLASRNQPRSAVGA